MITLQEYITEGRYDQEYVVSLIGCEDSYEGLPLRVTILVNKSNRREFEKWLEEQQDNVFAHAAGGNVEY